MLFRFEELQPGKEKQHEVSIDRAQVTTSYGEAIFTDIQAKYRLRLDPLGCVAHYDVHAVVSQECMRCGKPVQVEIDVSDWISLRNHQPKEAHLSLDGSDLNIRFVDEPGLDLEAFTLEIVDLEAPDFPRHPEGDPECVVIDTQDQEEKASPFNVLSKLLN